MSVRALKRISTRTPAPEKRTRQLPQTAAVVAGVLVGFSNEGRTPLVMFAGQPGSAALAARATLDLHAAHVGSEVVLVFAEGDPLQPIVMGVLRQQDANALESAPVMSKWMRMASGCSSPPASNWCCAVAATLTLTKAGKVLIEGTYISQPLHRRVADQGRLVIN